MKRNETSTQSIEAVARLMKFMGKPADPLPEAVQLRAMVLMLSNKRDVYYATTANSCSCPSAFYNSVQSCKHQRKYFPDSKKKQAKIDAESDAENERLHKTKWMGGFNGPIDPDTIEAKTESPETSKLANIIDAYAPLTTEDEIRYWQKKAEKLSQEAWSWSQ